MSRRGALLLLALLGGAPAGAQPLLQAERVRTYEAAEANQGVAVDAGSIYAIGNSEIGRYDKRTGKRTGGWTGDPKVFPHLNSCAPVGAELVCASSNYPATPMASTVEHLDRRGVRPRQAHPPALDPAGPPSRLADLGAAQGQRLVGGLREL